MKRKLVGLLAGTTLLTGVAYAATEKIEVSLKPLKYYFNGVKKELPKDQAGFIYKDRTYVPLRAVSELLGKEVDWDGKDLAVHINDNGHESNADKQTVKYEDGTYRGMFADRGDIQVAIEFKLEKNIVQSVNFRQLYNSKTDYRLEKEDPVIIGVRTQYEELIAYLVGKDIRENLNDLYSPGEIVKTEVKKNEIDVLSGATIRAGKVISALRDGLNRGIYSY